MKTRGTQEIVFPLEFNVDTIYIRSNIKQITTDRFTGWEYDEEQYSFQEYLSKIANENIALSEEVERLKEEILLMKTDNAN